MNEQTDKKAQQMKERVKEEQKKKVKELSSLAGLLKPSMGADNLIKSFIEQIKTFTRRKRVSEEKIKVADELMRTGKFSAARKEFSQILEIQEKIFDVHAQIETLEKLEKCEKEVEKVKAKKK